MVGLVSCGRVEAGVMESGGTALAVAVASAFGVTVAFAWGTVFLWGLVRGFLDSEGSEDL